jgi:hypothetical protein
MPRTGRFNPGKETRYPLYRRLGGLQSLYGRVQKISPPQGFDPRTAHPVVSRCTDYAIPAHKEKRQIRNLARLQMRHVQKISVGKSEEMKPLRRYRK